MRYNRVSKTHFSLSKSLTHPFRSLCFPSAAGCPPLQIPCAWLPELLRPSCMPSSRSPPWPSELASSGRRPPPARPPAAAAELARRRRSSRAAELLAPDGARAQPTQLARQRSCSRPADLTQVGLGHADARGEEHGGARRGRVSTALGRRRGWQAGQEEMGERK